MDKYHKPIDECKCKDSEWVEIDCPHCNGNGYVTGVTGFYSAASKSRCMGCDGYGVVYRKRADL